MNATSTQVPAPSSVPERNAGSATAERPYSTTSDLLEHPDPHIAAQAAAVENLLRCWVRENDLPAPGNGTLRIPLPASGTALLAPVHYWSPTGWHRFGLPTLADAPEPCPPADAVTVAALLARETAGAWAAAGASAEAPHTVTSPPGITHGPDLVARVADSVRRTATFISERREQPDGSDLFLAAEQALVLGHPLHPTPKSREGLSDAEARPYSPELRGFFPLHWIAVAPSLLATDSAWTERGRSVSAPRLLARLAGPELPLPDGYTALPLHPGSCARSAGVPRSRRCWTQAFSGTSARTAIRGIPPPPCVPSTNPAPPPC